MPQKVCPQCEAAVPVRRTCERCSHVFSKQKAECNLCGKRIRESETIEKPEKNKTRMESMRESETIEQTVQRKQQNEPRMRSFELCSMMLCEFLLI